MLTKFKMNLCKSTFVFIMPVRAGHCPYQLSEAWYHVVFDICSLNTQVYVKNSSTCVFWKQGGKGREKEGGKFAIN